MPGIAMASSCSHRTSAGTVERHPPVECGRQGPCRSETAHRLALWRIYVADCEPSSFRAPGQCLFNMTFGWSKHVLPVRALA